MAATGASLILPPTMAEAAGSRNLRFGLWTGKRWSRFGNRIDVRSKSRHIQGPYSWPHPVTGEKLTIYIRDNHDKKGKRTQYFTLREDGTALARVFDRRPGRPDRVFVGDAFMPQGQWSAGQSRNYTMQEYSGRSKKTYQLTLQVLDPARTYRGVRNSMRYEWIAKSGRKVVYHERFDYSPGVGFVRFDNRLN